MWYESLIKRGLLPEFILRLIFRLHFIIRTRREPKDVEQKQVYLNQFIEDLKKQPVALETQKANEQHYELPTSFFKKILGNNLKYSCCLWDRENKKKDLYKDLDHAEEDMLKLTCERANIKEGIKVLELGCGWGSLTLYMAQNYNIDKIVSLTNSETQKKYIESELKRLKLSNVKIIRQNVKYLEIYEKFDRIISIEMFEHLRNYEKFLEILHTITKPNGKLFIHIFTDKEHPYFFNMDEKNNWMTKYFFAGGIMPSYDLLLYFNNHFKIDKLWKVNGKHYQKTLEAWLQKMKKNKKEIKEIIKQTYGDENAKKWWNYWKIFFISCAEIFGFRDGNKRYVTHYLFSPVKR